MLISRELCCGKEQQKRRSPVFWQFSCLVTTEDAGAIEIPCIGGFYSPLASGFAWQITAVSFQVDAGTLNSELVVEELVAEAVH